MKFRLLSDVHLEFSQGMMDVPPLPEDADTMLILAGDIGLADKPYTYRYFMEDVSEQFSDVIWIPGNHEHYKTSHLRSVVKMQRQLDKQQIANIHVGDRFTIVFKDTAFICATLWTDMNNKDPLTIAYLESELGLNDYKMIRSGSTAAPYLRSLKSFDTLHEFSLSKDYIFEEIASCKADGLKTVVVSHHAPSFLSIAPAFQTLGKFMDNGGYASNLGNEIADGGPDVWVHGHIHHSNDYVIGDTRIVCNPRGYFGSELNPNFDPNLVIEL